MSKYVDGNPALAAWSGAGLHEVTLPSGTQVRLRIPSVETLLRQGALPTELRAIALRYVVGGVKTAEATTETLEQLMDLSQTLTVLCLQEVRDPASGDWYPGPEAIDEVDELHLPTEDLDAIEQIARRLKGPSQVTAESLLIRGLEVPPDLVESAEQEAAGTVTAFGPFRGEPRRASDGADGGSLRPKSGRVRRDPRSSGAVGG